MNEVRFQSHVIIIFQHIVEIQKNKNKNSNKGLNNKFAREITTTWAMC
jgi:hypothetical protein